MAFIKILLILVPLLSVANPVEDQILGLGEQRCLDMGAYDKASLGNKKIVRIRHLNNHCVLIKGVSLGYSDAIFFYGNTRTKVNIYVISKKISEIATSLGNVFQNNSSLSLHPLSDSLVVKGLITNYKDAQSLGQLRRVLKEKLILEARVTEELMQVCRKRLEETLPQFTVIQKEQGILVQGFYKTEQERDFLEDTIYSIFPLAKISWTTGDAIDQQAKVRLRLLEVRNTSGEARGLDWNKIVNNFISVSPNSVDMSSRFDAALMALQRAGKVQVLSQSSMVIKAKENANLFAGGEFPVVVRSKKETFVNWKKYGLNIDVVLQGIHHQVLKFEIKINHSELDHSNASQGIPAIFENSMKSVVQAKNKQPLILTGLEKVIEGENKEGVWGLSQIPILGALFRIQNNERSKNQLIFTMEPEISYDFTSAF